MKDKIHNSLSGIVPDETQKKRIYENIMYPKKKIGGYKILNVIPLMACFLICFTLYNTKLNELDITPMPRTVNMENIYYKDKCYTNVFSNYQIGKKLDNINIDGVDYKVYENKLGGIVILRNSNYEVYKECEDF